MTQQQLMPRSLRRIRLYGPLGVRFGREFHLDVATPGEAVRALTALRPGFDAYLAGSKDNGVGYRVYAGKRMLSEPELVFPANADIRIAPMPLGGKNGGIVNILLGTALIVASFFLPGSQMFLAGVFSAGLSIALGGVVMLLSPPPKDGKSKDKPENEPNYAFNGPINTQAQGNPVPVLYGELYTGSAIISAGINVDDDVYIPNGHYYGPAAGVLGNFTYWWDFEGNTRAYNSAGTLLPSGGEADWEQTYGGGVSYAGAGVSGLGVRATMSLRNKLIPQYIDVEHSWAVYFHVHVVSALVRLERFGVGTNTTFDSEPIAWVQFDTYDKGFGMLQTRMQYIVRNNIAGLHYTGYVDIPDGVNMFAIRYNHLTNSVVFCRNGNMAAASFTPTSGLRGDLSDLFMNGNGAAFANFIHLSDRWIYFKGYIPTAEEHAFLLQGLSYTGSVAAAVKPNGTGSGGGDIVNLIRHALGG